MFFEFQALRALVSLLKARWELSRATSEAGYSTEAVVVTALLVGLAVAAVAIIATKVLAKANSISTGP